MRKLSGIAFSLASTAVLCCLQLPLEAQNAFDPVYAGEAGSIREEVELFTDRSLYICGENIRFRADCHVEGLDETVPWSSVLYVELIDAGGKSVAGSKHPIRDGRVSGQIGIPGEGLTGHYFLKGYTRWMRNMGPESFSYVPLKIVNPLKKEVGRPAGRPMDGLTLESRFYGKGMLRIGQVQQVYGREEEARFRVFLAPGGRTEELDCCVSMVPEGSIDTLSSSSLTSVGNQAGPVFRVDYLPDLEGPSVSGRVLGGDGSPVPYVRLHFSLLGKGPDYITGISDGTGRFVISTPERTGEQEWIMVPDPQGKGPVEVRIDQDFDQGEFRPPHWDFELSESERILAADMALDVQLDRVYRTGAKAVPADSIPGSGQEEAPEFYGTPPFRLELDEFIDLPSLEEVFINLVPHVYVVKRKGKKQLLIESMNTAIGVYPPLIMVDHIPVFDLDALLAMVPEGIRRLDVINEVYVKGELACGGLISIYTRKGDMAGLDLSPGSYFFDFASLSPPEPVSKEVPAAGDRIPDTRNTLLWRDHVRVGRRTPVELSCITPERPGTYLVLVRGRTADGEVQAAVARFTVK
jgi:hypothetical protein